MTEHVGRETAGSEQFVVFLSVSGGEVNDASARGRRYVSGRKDREGGYLGVVGEQRAIPCLEQCATCEDTSCEFLACTEYEKTHQGGHNELYQACRLS